MNEENQYIENKEDKNIGFRTSIYFQLPIIDDKMKEISEGVENLKLNSNFMTPTTLTPRTSDPKALEFYKNYISSDLLKRLEESSPIKSNTPGFNRKISELFLLNCDKNSESEQDHNSQDQKEKSDNSKNDSKNETTEINFDENTLNLKQFPHNNKNFLPKNPNLDDSNFSPKKDNSFTQNDEEKPAIHINFNINKDSPKHQKQIKYTDSKSSPIYNYYNDNSEYFSQIFSNQLKKIDSNSNLNEKNEDSPTKTIKSEIFMNENSPTKNIKSGIFKNENPYNDSSQPTSYQRGQFPNKNKDSRNFPQSCEMNDLCNVPITNYQNNFISQSQEGFINNKNSNYYNNLNANDNKNYLHKENQGNFINYDNRENCSNQNINNFYNPGYNTIGNQKNFQNNNQIINSQNNQNYYNNQNNLQYFPYAKNNNIQFGYMQNPMINKDNQFLNQNLFTPNNQTNNSMENLNYPNLNEQMKNQFWQKNFGNQNNNFNLMNNINMENNTNSLNNPQNNKYNSKFDSEEYFVEMFGKRGWICDSCNNFNYETRTKCNRCGILKIPKKITNKKNKFNLNPQNNFENQQLPIQNIINAENNNFNNFTNQNFETNLIPNDLIINSPNPINNYNQLSFDKSDEINKNPQEKENELLNLSMNSLDKQIKKPFVEREGDWVCIKCKNLNFSFRLICNRCQMPKIESDKMFSQYMNNLINYIKFNEIMQNKNIGNQPINLVNNQGFVNNNNINISNNFYHTDLINQKIMKNNNLNKIQCNGIPIKQQGMFKNETDNCCNYGKVYSENKTQGYDDLNGVINNQNNLSNGKYEKEMTDNMFN